MLFCKYKWTAVLFLCFSMSLCASLTYSANSKYKYDLAVAMIFRDEAPYLKEWIEYHKLVGVQRFYLYNNESTDNFKEVLKPYIDEGEVKLYQWKGTHLNTLDWNGIQCLAYVDAASKAKKAKVKWLAVIDSDEFLVPAVDKTLTSLLARYENDTLGGVRAKWVMFGTSHVPKIPENRLLVETLILNEGWVPHAMWKSIFRPERVNLSTAGGPHIGPHTPEYLSGWGDTTLDYSEIQCNHYWTRDEYYFYNVKIPRRSKWVTPQETCEQWASTFNRSTPAGDAILRFITQLRRRMGLRD